ncbi:glutamate-cysteine ligase family protein [Streptomyces sp. NPDC029003]|uniref:carboxylate-amine ligase n=1 Tax=Streptomyces sp. NPDC029003 TaxID=3155125 RepID=UPI0033E98BE8
MSISCGCATPLPPPHSRTAAGSPSPPSRRSGMPCPYVHVGMPDRETGVAVLNRLRVWLPTLLAMSANGPLWEGRETGFASWRTIVFGRWPVSGPPPHFAGLADYEAWADARVEVAGFTRRAGGARTPPMPKDSSRRSGSRSPLRAAAGRSAPMSQSVTTAMRAVPHSTPQERADHGKEARRRSPRSGTPRTGRLPTDRTLWRSWRSSPRPGYPSWSPSATAE